jgi:hypothetical protein
LYYALADDTFTALTRLLTPTHRAFDEWCYVWLEELFADVFGCWMAGPAVALTVQHVMRSHSAHEFVTSDSDHPVPLVRPYIHMKALESRAQENHSVSVWSDIAELLKAEWDIQARRYATQFEVGDGQAIEVTDALVAGRTLDVKRPVDALIAAIVKRLSLFSLAPNDWRSSVTRPPDLTALDAQIGGFMSSDTPVVFEVALQAAAEIACASDFRTWALCHFDWPRRDATPTESGEDQALKDLLLNTSSQASTAIPETAWWRLVAAGGWTTEPAEVPWPHG